MNTRNCNEDRISKEFQSIRIIADGFRGEDLIDLDMLTWEEDEYLTLKEISDQLTQRGYKLIYVWAEIGVSGKIYQYGNYPQFPYWVEHGQTKGFA